ncbi:hypothetical protein CY0110_18802 [Crocosphaera chwakensis CCY0110]|uniref:Uncharacterized protein n=1 Tax=Crocosphaera chwakensis CCY0110 TaxID=391612 RepID=A3IJ92_9CHRO|nr:hypothetical protein CY0110_18802 [Crocosphaera chwakensis CCY0110]
MTCFIFMPNRNFMLMISLIFS